MMEQEMEVNEMKEETNSELKKKESITVENIEWSCKKNRTEKIEKYKQKR